MKEVLDGCFVSFVQVKNNAEFMFVFVGFRFEIYDYYYDDDGDSSYDLEI